MLSPIQIFPVAVLDINLAPKSKYHSLSLSLSLSLFATRVCTHAQKCLDLAVVVTMIEHI